VSDNPTAADAGGDSHEQVRAVFADHGITDAALACRRDDDPSDRWWCPSCYRAFQTAGGLVQHHAATHDQSVIDGICGTETWATVAEQLYIDEGLSMAQIFSALPAHTGQKSVRTDLCRFDLFQPAPSTADSNSEASSAGAESPSKSTRDGELALRKRLLEMSVEEFDAIVATRNDRGGGS
jgi:hypothetical protein